MAKPMELSNGIKDSIVNLHKAGDGCRKIAKAITRPLSTVKAFLTRYKVRGHIHNLRRPGRPQKLSPGTVRRVVREMEKNIRTTVKTVRESLEEAGTSASRKTIKRALHHAGLKSLRSRRTALYQKCHHKARLEFAKRHSEEGEDF